MNQRKHTFLRVVAVGTGLLVSLLCLYPYWWMLVSAFRNTQDILSSPLRPWPN